MSSPAPELAIQVENLSLRLRTGEPVIEDVSFEVGQGDGAGEAVEWYARMVAQDD